MSLPRYDVRLRRLPASARFELGGPIARLAEGLERAGLPMPAAANTAAISGAVRVLLIGPRRMIVAAPMSERAEIGARLATAFSADPLALAADVSGSTATFALSGRGLGDVLAQGVVHDLSAGSFPRDAVIATEAWGIGCMIEHSAAGGDVLFTVDAAHAGYAEAWLRAAAGEPMTLAPGTMRAPPPAIRVG